MRAVVLLVALLTAEVLYGIGEQVIVIGGETGWQAIETKAHVIETSFLRPYPVLTLSSAQTYFSEDLFFSFDGILQDSAGNYSVSSTENIVLAPRENARFGGGAALFMGLSDAISIVPHSREALFSTGQILRDFSIEMWLYPVTAENGENVLQWNAICENDSYISQDIIVTFVRNRLQWTFSNFFTLSKDIVLSGQTSLVPKTWSHHLIRFDSDNGLLEYVVDGRIECIVFVTENGHEGTQVYQSNVGTNGFFVLGKNFFGMIDEFIISPRFVSEISLGTYRQNSGRVETIPIDLGDINSELVSVDVKNGPLVDDSAIELFMRVSNNPYHFEEWRALTAGVSLRDVRGRYVQLAIVLYPSKDRHFSPYIDSIQLNYRQNKAPMPPTQLIAYARNGVVELSWRASISRNTVGYLVYYGTAQGEYFGKDSSLGISPINVGARTSIRIDGLKNGTLYYFSIAAYDSLEPFHIGDYSSEVSARPLRQ
ncbi:MAG: hypothetical protein LBQ77_07085 [Treponema sp.]|jgi:hypothetical protein|nr:hypothetical protein [Treponema sp.]